VFWFNAFLPSEGDKKGGVRTIMNIK